MQYHNKKDDVHYRTVSDNLKTIRAPENVKTAYEKRYLNILDSAMSEAEQLLKDAKHLLQNQH